MEAQMHGCRLPNLIAQYDIISYYIVQDIIEVVVYSSLVSQTIELLEDPAYRSSKPPRDTAVLTGGSSAADTLYT